MEDGCKTTEKETERMEENQEKAVANAAVVAT
jgi:hypothetical protein